MSLLGRLAVGWHPERAATIALAHILDVDASPDMASAFVGLLGETRPLQFTPVRVESNPDQKDDSLPDVTIYDDARRPRVFIETVFWEGVPQAQPLEYLAKLPGDAPSGLVYIAPRKRMRFLWEVLRKRCADSPGSRVEDETQRGQAVWARVGGHVLLVASWAHALEELRRVADDPAVEQDIAQLRGLTKRMETAAFLPLDEEEAADTAVARRLLDFRDLVDQITRRLEQDGLARNVKTSRSSYRMRRDQGRDMLVHGRFQMRFGLEIGAWRDSGITPLWWVLTSSKTFNVLGHWRRIKQHFDGVRSYSDSLYIPIRLRTGVDRAGVIDDAVARMHGIAETLLDVWQNKPPTRRAPVTHRILLTKVIRGIGRQPEPAATQALLSVLNASHEIAHRFIDLLGGGDFEIGRIESERAYAKGVKPDLSIHDTGKTLRILVENKLDALLQPSQPVGYLYVLPPHPASKLAFIVPESRLDSLWHELKAKCASEGLDLADESPPGDPRRARIANRTMLITSWKRVLDALQRVASESGHSAVEQDIAQLRGLAEG
jgi:hypothetical protein